MDSPASAALHAIVKARGGFGHREHLELAWTLLRNHPRAVAEEMMTVAIREVARSHGTPDRFHETMTRAWVRLVAAHVAASGPGSFDEFLTTNTGLLDRQLLDRHYTASRLWSETARQGWVLPDRRELPLHV